MNHHIRSAKFVIVASALVSGLVVTVPSVTAAQKAAKPSATCVGKTPDGQLFARLNVQTPGIQTKAVAAIRKKMYVSNNRTRSDGSVLLLGLPDAQISIQVLPAGVKKTLPLSAKCPLPQSFGSVFVAPEPAIVTGSQRTVIGFGSGVVVVPEGSFKSARIKVSQSAASIAPSGVSSHTGSISVDTEGSVAKPESIIMEFPAPSSEGAITALFRSKGSDRSIELPITRRGDVLQVVLPGPGVVELVFQKPTAQQTKVEVSKPSTLGEVSPAELPATTKTPTKPGDAPAAPTSAGTTARSTAITLKDFSGAVQSSGWCQWQSTFTFETTVTPNTGVASVTYSINGPVSFAPTATTAPFRYTGDLPYGTYTVTATPRLTNNTNGTPSPVSFVRDAKCLGGDPSVPGNSTPTSVSPSSATTSVPSGSSGPRSTSITLKNFAGVPQPKDWCQWQSTFTFETTITPSTGVASVTYSVTGPIALAPKVSNAPYRYTDDLPFGNYTMVAVPQLTDGTTGTTASITFVRDAKCLGGDPNPTTSTPAPTVNRSTSLTLKNFAGAPQPQGWCQWQSTFTFEASVTPSGGVASVAYSIVGPIVLAPTLTTAPYRYTDDLPFGNYTVIAIPRLTDGTTAPASAPFSFVREPSCLGGDPSLTTTTAATTTTPTTTPVVRSIGLTLKNFAGVPQPAGWCQWQSTFTFETVVTPSAGVASVTYSVAGPVALSPTVGVAPYRYTDDYPFGSYTVTAVSRLTDGSTGPSASISFVREASCLGGDPSLKK